MSIKIMSLVFQSYQGGGSEMLLALALADHANDQGERIFPGIPSLARKTRQSERTVQRQLTAMVEEGWLEIVTPGGAGRRSSTRYRISPIWIQGALLEAALEQPQEPMFKGDNLSPLPPESPPLGSQPRPLRVTQLCHPNHQEPSRQQQRPPPVSASDPLAAADQQAGEGEDGKILEAMAEELAKGREIKNPAAFAARIRGDRRHVTERAGRAYLDQAKAMLEARRELAREQSARSRQQGEDRVADLLERSRERGERELERLLRTDNEFPHVRVPGGGEIEAPRSLQEADFPRSRSNSEKCHE